MPQEIELVHCEAPTYEALCTPKEKTFPTAPSLDLKLTREALPSLALSMVGLIFSGWFLDITQYWFVFKQHSELLIMVLVLLNLKGNLEMTLSSRLATAANMGLLDNTEERWRVCTENLVFVQLQSVAFGLMVGFVAFLFSSLSRLEFALSKFLLLVNTGMLTASFAGFIVSAAVCLVVVQSRLKHVDPDNIAAPIAASLGDVTASVALVLSASILCWMRSKLVLTVVFILLSLQLPVLYHQLKHHSHLHNALFTGTVPVLASILVSSIAGVFFERFNLKGLAVSLPVVNGIIGNIACIHASRLTTNLHATRKEALVEGTLVTLGIPLHLFFLAFLHFMTDTTLTVPFVALYLCICTLLTFSMLRLSSFIIANCWQRQLDPDTFAMPVITALCDLLGTISLVILFHIKQ